MRDAFGVERPDLVSKSWEKRSAGERAAFQGKGTGWNRTGENAALGASMLTAGGAGVAGGLGLHQASLARGDKNWAKIEGALKNSSVASAQSAAGKGEHAAAARHYSKARMWRENQLASLARARSGNVKAGLLGAGALAGLGAAEAGVIGVGLRREKRAADWRKKQGMKPRNKWTGLVQD